MCRLIAIFFILANFYTISSIGYQPNNFNSISFAIKIATITNIPDAQKCFNSTISTGLKEQHESVATVKHSQILVAAAVMKAWENIFDILNQYEISPNILNTSIWKLLYLFNKYQFSDDILKQPNSSLIYLINNYNFPSQVVYIQEISGETFLTLAVRKNLFSIVKLLLERGADPNVYNEHNETPLMIATRNGNIKIIELLKKHNALK